MSYSGASVNHIIQLLDAMVWEDIIIIIYYTIPCKSDS